MRIWERQYLESMLMSSHGPTKIAATRTSYFYGMSVEEITELSGLPAWRVQQAILGDATKRQNDD